MPTSPRDQEDMPSLNSISKAEMWERAKAAVAVEEIAMTQDLPRQPQPVVLEFKGDPRDIEVYLRKIQAAVERNSYDNAVRVGTTNRLVIYPRAVND